MHNRFNKLRAQNERSLLLIDAFRRRLVTIFDDAGLVRDLHSLSIVERGQGTLYLEKPRDEHGHGDRADAFSLALKLADKFCADAAQDQSVPVQYVI